jgi:hypothetical protein
VLAYDRKDAELSHFGNFFGERLGMNQLLRPFRCYSSDKSVHNADQSNDKPRHLNFSFSFRECDRRSSVEGKIELTPEQYT